MHELLISKGYKPRKGSVYTCRCGTDFYRSPYYEGKFKESFCSRKCRGNFSRIEKDVFSCLVCKKDFIRYKSYTMVRGKSKCCSRKCGGIQATLERSMGKEDILANKQLIRRMDHIFSKYIRLRDTQDGWGMCCSCGQRKTYDQFDAGHFINRKWMSTRWREDNVHAQCIACNRFDEGNPAGYSLFMIRKYGEKHVEYLNLIKTELMRYTDFDIRLLTKEYKDKVKSMDKVKA